MVARLRRCAVVRENLLYYSELIVICIAGIHAASQEVFSTCNCLVCCIVIYVYFAGINATSQEVFSRTRGVEINLAIIVCYYVHPKPLHVTIGARDQD